MKPRIKFYEKCSTDFLSEKYHPLNIFPKIRSVLEIRSANEQYTFRILMC